MSPGMNCEANAETSNETGRAKGVFIGAEHHAKLRRLVVETSPVPTMASMVEWLIDMELARRTNGQIPIPTATRVSDRLDVTI